MYVTHFHHFCLLVSLFWPLPMSDSASSSLLLSRLDACLSLVLLGVLVTQWISLRLLTEPWVLFHHQPHQQGKGLRLLQLAWTACRSSGRGGPCITALTTASTATVQRNRPPLHCSHSREGSLIGVPEALKMCSPLWSDTLPGIYSEEITRNKTSNLYERLPSCIYL